MREVPADLDRQAIEGQTPFAGSGLWFVPVRHEGNQRSSPEEADRVAEIVRDWLSGNVHWRDSKNDRHVLTVNDILIIAPYNAQVAELTARLPGARIGECSLSTA